jgi:hypothetical protein
VLVSLTFLSLVVVAPEVVNAAAVAEQAVICM